MHLSSQVQAARIHHPFPRLRILTLFTPGGLEEGFRGVGSPAERLELPTGATTYSTADLKQAAQRLGAYGERVLALDEIADELPLYTKTAFTEPRQMTKQ
jgi:hypothetical protein